MRNFGRKVRTRNIPILVVLLALTVARCIGEIPAPETLDQQLLQAVNEGNAAVVLQLVGRGAHLDSKSIDGVTPLIIAVKNNNREMAKLLLDLGASTGIIDNDGKSALIYAAQANDKELVRVIVDKIASNGKRTASAAVETAQNSNATVHRDEITYPVFVDRKTPTMRLVDKHESLIVWAFVLIVICFVLSALARRGAMARRVVQTGVIASARIDRMEQTGIEIDDQPIVRFWVTALPEGGPPVQLKVKQKISLVNVPRKDDRVIVAYNPRNPKEAVITTQEHVDQLRSALTEISSDMPKSQIPGNATEN